MTRRLWLGFATFCFAAGVSAASTADDAGEDSLALERITVTATRTPQPLVGYPGSVTRFESEELARIDATHPAELFVRVPGAWVSRGSGQEHLTAIRSPVFTGAGACGEFLLLENGVPVRPAGLCNVNGLFELNLEQADALEVVRGPGSVLYGSNALHGLVHLLTADPRSTHGRRTAITAGGDDYYRAAFDLATMREGHGWRLLGHASHDGDFRNSAGYTQQKLNAGHVRRAGGGELVFSLSAMNLDQQTAGFITGENAYRDRELSERNLNPDAFRDAESVRLVTHWLPRNGHEQGPDIRFYARRSRMAFLQHFLPGKPLEENGQDSAGMLYAHRWRPAEDTRIIAGVDIEKADIFLSETQAAPIEEGPPFLRETRPAGRHYDFTVGSELSAAYTAIEQRLAKRWRLDIGLRYERLQYDYDNRMLDGNTREDGSECGFGGCLFSRPADRTDEFTYTAPKAAISFSVSPSHDTYLALARGFRAPQVTELYRLQRGQVVAQIDAERLDAVELGLRGSARTARYDIALYAMRKYNVIFRDANGFNVDDARTRHRGIELEVEFSLSPRLSAALAASHAIHTYDSSHAIEQGETVTRGNDIDTAPRLLASGRVIGRPAAKWLLELEAVHVGEYWLDAANAHRYPGHTLLNARAAWHTAPSWQIELAVTNLADRAYAERADFAFGDYRYFPGRPRAAYLEIERYFD
ncbi:MAG TPA: TonB-dependent receptor [Gammaproteobacteria bacterium]|nr:TonB-dependent receptor [Gammaproteobacteria bacterium]